MSDLAQKLADQPLNLADQATRPAERDESPGRGRGPTLRRSKLSVTMVELDQYREHSILKIQMEHRHAPEEKHRRYFAQAIDERLVLSIGTTITLQYSGKETPVKLTWCEARMRFDKLTISDLTLCGQFDGVKVMEAILDGEAFLL